MYELLWVPLYIYMYSRSWVTIFTLHTHNHVQSYVLSHTAVPVLEQEFPNWWARAWLGAGGSGCMRLTVAGPAALLKPPPDQY